MAGLGFMCLMALETLPPLDLYTVRRAATTIAPGEEVAIERRQIWPDEPSLIVELSGHALAVHAYRGRIPDREYFDAVSGNLFWPDAADAMARHSACLSICAATAPRDPAEARDQAVAVTRLAVSFAQALPLLGLHWYGTGRMTSPERLATTPREIDLGFWPVDVWLGYVPLGTDRPGEPLVFGARTIGASPFLGCEIELPPEPVPEKIERIRTLFDAVRVLVGAGEGVEDSKVIETPGKSGRTWQLQFARGAKAPLARLVDLTGD